MEDNDGTKMRPILDWARAEGREREISPELLEMAGPQKLADEQVNQKKEGMEEARKARNFSLSDALRAEVSAGGIIVENTRNGVQWRRKAGYERKLTSLCPVAIKLDQSEVHAPDHLTWGIISCDGCKERFAVGPNRIYGSRTTEQQCVAQLEKLLKKDHLNDRPHQNSYELCG